MMQWSTTGTGEAGAVRRGCRFRRARRGDGLVRDPGALDPGPRRLGAGQLGLALAFPALGASLVMPLAGAGQPPLRRPDRPARLLALWTLALILPVARAEPADAVRRAVRLRRDGGHGRRGDERARASRSSTGWAGRSCPGCTACGASGALLGSAVGTVAAHAGSTPELHHAVAAVVLTVVGVVACQWVLDLHPAEDEEPPPRFALPPKSALLIGAVGFCAVFAEGASLDWSAVYLRDVSTARPGSRPRARPGSR